MAIKAFTMATDTETIVPNCRFSWTSGETTSVEYVFDQTGDVPLVPAHTAASSESSSFQSDTYKSITETTEYDDYEIECRMGMTMWKALDTLKQSSTPTDRQGVGVWYDDTGTAVKTLAMTFSGVTTPPTLGEQTTGHPTATVSWIITGDVPDDDD